MKSFDPTYPLLPVASIICAALLLLVFVTRAVRGSWNLGVSMLCFWLFLENLTNGVSSILWADNANVKHIVYCDIVTHVQLFSSVVRPACTLVITRKLFQIISMRAIDAQSTTAKRLDTALELGLTVVLPTLATAVFYYIVQDHRFTVLEGVGCQYSVSGSGLSIVFILSWPIILPAISAFFYCPRIVLAFRRHTKETDNFFASNSALSRGQYFRTLAIGCIDILLSFPFALFKIANVVEVVIDTSRDHRFLFYAGWHATHASFAPSVVPGSLLKTVALWALVTTWLGIWSAVVLGLAVFCLFGLTPSARETYRRAIRVPADRIRGETTVEPKMSFAPRARPPLALSRSDDSVSTSRSHSEGDKSFKAHADIVTTVDVEYGIAE